MSPTNPKVFAKGVTALSHHRVTFPASPISPKMTPIVKKNYLCLRVALSIFSSYND